MNHLITSLIALWFFLGATEHAHALPVAGVIAGLFFTAGTTAFTIASVVISIALGVGLNIVASLLMRKSPSQDIGGTTGKLQGGGVVPRSFPLGKTVVTHSLVYANTFGQDGKTPNAYMSVVYALADLPVGGGNACLAEWWCNGSKVTYNPAATTETEGIPIPEFAKDGRNHLWIRVYDGTQTTADSRLVALFGSDADRPYGSDRVGNGVVYVVVTCRLNREVMGGVPQSKFVLNGIPLYDVRDDTTAGGDGSQRWATQSTWGASPTNPIVQAYNVIRGISYDGQWFYGGQTVSSAQLPIAAWSAAANECDSLIDKAEGGTEAQFTAAGEVRCDMEPGDVLDMLLIACNGRMGEVGGVYKPHVGAASSAVLSITDDDILSTAASVFNPFKGLAEQVNFVTGKYIEPGEGWAAKDAPELSSAEYEVVDGRRNPVDVTYDFVTNGRQVQRLMKSALLEARRERTHVLPMPPDAYFLEPAVDTISWTSTRNGYVNKLFRVDQFDDEDNIGIGLAVTEVDPSDYDWDADNDEQAIVISPTPLVFPPAQAISDFAVEPITLDAFAAVPRPGIRLTWDGDELDDVIGVQFEVRRYETTDVVFEGQSPESTVATGVFDISANLAAYTSYQVRARFVPGSGRTTTWSNWLPVVTPRINVNWLALDEDLRRRVDDVLGYSESSVWTRIREVQALLEGLGEATAREASSSMTLIAGVEGRSKAAIIQEASVRASETSAQATINNGLQVSIDNILLDLDDPTTGLSAVGTALSTLSGRVDVTEDDIIVQSDALTVVEGRIDHPDTGLLASATGIINLWSEVGIIDGKAGDAIADASAASGVAISAEAAVGTVSASGTFKMVAAVSLPTGATSGVKMLVKAADSGNFAEAGLEAYVQAGGGGSPSGHVVLVGDRIYRRPSSGGDPVLMVDSAGRFVGDALGSGIVSTYYEFTRPERGSDDTMGTGNTASGAGNGWYVDGTDLVGSITIPANPNAIGAGAPNSTYGAVLTTVNASVRNTVFGWALGSAYPLVVAFRVRFDDNAGSVYWSEEGLIACSSGYTGSTAAYGFGGNPGTLTDIVPVPAGTYSVYLEYRWGPRTQNGITPTPSDPNGVPVRINAKIVCLLLKK